MRGTYLESWFSCLVGGVQKTLKEEGRKQAEEKHWKGKERKTKYTTGWPQGLEKLENKYTFWCGKTGKAGVPKMFN